MSIITQWHSFHPSCSVRRRRGHDIKLTRGSHVFRSVLIQPCGVHVNTESVFLAVIIPPVPFRSCLDNLLKLSIEAMREIHSTSHHQSPVPKLLVLVFKYLNIYIYLEGWTIFIHFALIEDCGLLNIYIYLSKYFWVIWVSWKNMVVVPAQSLQYFWQKTVSSRSGVQALHPIITGSVVQSPAPLVHLSKCRWVRHWSSSCTSWFNYHQIICQTLGNCFWYYLLVTQSW